MRRIDAIHRSLPRIAGVALAAATVSACGHTAEVGAGRTVRLALTEYRVVPQSIHAIPGVLTILVRNDGRLTHNLTVSQNGNVIGQTTPLAPGASTQLALNLAPGQYLVASTLLSDETLGAYGTLTVG
jgi:hypothetical protein